MRYNDGKMPEKPTSTRAHGLSKRKRIRLSPPDYCNPASTFSVTISAEKRRALFVDRAFNREVINLLRTVAQHDGVRIKTYCLMPTHLHLLAQPGRRSLVASIAEFKKRSGDEGRRMLGVEKLWQRSFFDHRLRSSESEAEQIGYIRLNPVQAGLVEHPDDWPWTGSLNYP